MKITIEFKDINEYLEFKEKTVQECKTQEQLITKNVINDIEKIISKSFA